MRRLQSTAATLGVVLHVSMVVYISENMMVALNLALFAAMMIAGYALFIDVGWGRLSPGNLFRALSRR